MVTRATPTPGDLLSWDVSALASIAERSGQIADAILKASNSMHTAIHDDLAWKGEARNAAEDKADREQSQMRAVATAFYDLATACAGAARDMEYPLAEIKTIFQYYVVTPVAVADDWIITGVDDWNSEAGSQLSRLAGLVSVLGAADALWGAKIADANEELTKLASPDSAAEISYGLPQPPGGWSNDPAMRMAQEIAYGHAWDKHLDNFQGMTQDDLAEKVYQIIQGPQMERLGKDYKGDPVMMSFDGFIVIVDPSSDDHGTVYRPKDPMGEFIRLTGQSDDPSLGPPRGTGGTGGTPPGKQGGNR